LASLVGRLRYNNVNRTSDGIQIDKTLSFSKHIATAINKTEAVGHHLYPILNNKSPLTTKIYIYKTYMRPILTYAAPAWYSNASKSNKKKIETVRSSTLRRITDLRWFVSNHTIKNSSRIQTVQEFIASTIEKLKINIAASNHPHTDKLKTNPSSFKTFKNRPILL